MAKLYGMMRLGRDAELRKAGDQSVCNLSLVYNYGQKGEDGNYPSQWIDAALWGKRADALAQYLKKGTSHCFTIDGVHIESYTDKDGYEAKKLSGTVADVELGPKQSDAAPQRQAPQRQQAPQQRQAAPRQQPQRQQAPQNQNDGFSDMGDDIPY